MTPSLSRLLTASCAAAFLTACAVGPRAPEPSLPPSGSGAFINTDASDAFSAAAPRDDWWTLYGDAALDALVELALVENRDLAEAEANLRMVRAALGEARSARLPSTGLSAGARRSREADPTGTARQAETDVYDAGLEVAYEVDLFGRVGASVRAAQADAAAAEAARDGARVLVAAETARAYFDVCSANAQIASAERSLSLQSESVRLTRALSDQGQGSALDVARADSALQSGRAALPPLRAQRDAALYRLAVLTGRAPGDLLSSGLASGVETCARPPQLARPIPVGDGAVLLARRPDVRQAEQALAGSAARAQVATAALYPSVRLGGSVGTTALDGVSLGEDATVRFSFGPLISWSFPNMAAARARMVQAEAGVDVALARFDQTVLTALQEVETALSAYAHELDRRQALLLARDRAAEAERLSRLRFEAGSDSFLTLLDAQRTLVAAEAALAASEAAVANHQATLFKALAGGWPE